MSVEEQKQYKELTEQFQELQGELQTIIDARQKLESQQQENFGVQKEFKKVSDTSTIYKLIGPVLLKQDKPEATMSVDGRLEFIENEIKRIEKQIKELQQKSDDKKMEIFQLQTSLQQAQQGEAAA